jgi:hypothetical protein
MTKCNGLASENLLFDLFGTEGAESLQVELAKEDQLGTGTGTTTAWLKSVNL